MNCSPENIQMLSELSCGVFRCRNDSDMTLTFVNRRFLELCGYTERQLREEAGDSLATLVHPPDLKLVHGGARCGDKVWPFHAEYRIHRRDCTVLWLAERSAYLPEEDEYLGVVIDISTRMQDIEVLKDKANKDSLTGLINRMAFQEQASEALVRSGDLRSAVMILDIDDFKNVNDSCGHLTADSVLIEIAAVLRRSFRSTDLVGRVGGDEMMVFIKDVPDAEFVRRKVRQTQEAIAQCGRQLRLNIPISCSVGVAVAPEDGSTFSELYRRADEALYQVKAHGKNGMLLYQDLRHIDRQPNRRTRTEIESDRELDPTSVDGLVGHVFKLLFENTDLQDPLGHLLYLIGQKLDASLVCLLEPAEGGAKVTRFWHAEGVTLTQTSLPAEAIPHSDPGSLFIQTDPLRLPEPAELAHPAVKSLVSRRFERNGTLVGGLLVADCSPAARHWSPEQQELLLHLSRLIELYLNMDA